VYAIFPTFLKQKGCKSIKKTVKTQKTCYVVLLLWWWPKRYTARSVWDSYYVSCFTV